MSRVNVEFNEMTERTVINQTDISKLENETANPSIRTLRRLADGMGMRMKLVFEPIGI